MFGVEPICKVLTSHGLKIATSTYYAAKNRTPSARSIHDAELKTQISRVHADNFGVYGVRKVWRQLHREGIPVARCTVARLMRDLGLEGARRGKKIRTTIHDDRHDRPSDLLRRDFTASRPNERRVADFTYAATWSGIVYVAFVMNVFSRATVGWSAATSKRAKPRRPWHGLADVELGTAEWADWFNNQRLHTAIGDIPPHEHETNHYAQHQSQPAAGVNA
ncbi:transposase InsO family protein [Streptomyces nodosus]|uniref:Transposase n=1 Tax=Streptomyces nodosus TaxID=40318 RepID=A0A0B5DSM6_9ACTN|nr:transposase [Streptomyces nodosus]MBB4795080.1 transposase InsO family protein [Streptomyces nodosus]